MFLVTKRVASLAGVSREGSLAALGQLRGFSSGDFSYTPPGRNHLFVPGMQEYSFHLPDPDSFR